MSQDYLIFTLDSGTYKIGTGGEPSSNGLSQNVKNVVIPNYYLKIPVTKLGYHSLNWNSVIESIYIPSNIVEIQTDAFAHDKNLKSVIFAKNSSLKVIERGFAYNCPQLKKIILPGSLNSVGLFFLGLDYLDDVYYCGFNELKETTMFESDSGVKTHPQRIHILMNYGFSSIGKITNLLRDKKCEKISNIITYRCHHKVANIHVFVMCLVLNS